MRITYDPDVDMGSIYFTDEKLTPGRYTIAVPQLPEFPRVLLDFKDGKLVSMEIFGKDIMPDDFWEGCEIL